jgi:hypothetical protein
LPSAYFDLAEMTPSSNYPFRSVLIFVCTSVAQVTRKLAEKKVFKKKSCDPICVLLQLQGLDGFLHAVSSPQHLQSRDASLSELGQ